MEKLEVGDLVWYHSVIGSVKAKIIKISPHEREDRYTFSVTERGSNVWPFGYEHTTTATWLSPRGRRK